MVLFLHDASRQAVSVIARQYRNPGLYDRGAAVQLGGNEVDRGSGFPVAGVQGALVCIQSRILWQQGWMNVQQAPEKGLDENRSEDSHETGQDHQIRLVG